VRQADADDSPAVSDPLRGSRSSIALSVPSGGLGAQREDGGATKGLVSIPSGKRDKRCPWCESNYLNTSHRDGVEVTRLPSQESLEEEVRELTHLFRADESFVDLRNALSSRGLSVSETVLAGLIEGEDESCYGVVVGLDGGCARFEMTPDGMFTQWETVHDLDSLSSDFQAVRVAFDMVRGGHVF